MKKLLSIDVLGMTASLLCLIHCMFLPWLITIVGAYFASSVQSPYFHGVMLAVSIIIGLPVFIISFLKYKSKIIILAGVTGLSLTAFGTIKNDNCCPDVPSRVNCQSACEHKNNTSCNTIEEVETQEENPQEVETQEENPQEVETMQINTIPLGVSLLIFAHFLNFRKKRSCRNDCCN
jgi:hypothetical protein